MSAPGFHCVAEGEGCGCGPGECRWRRSNLRALEAIGEGLQVLDARRAFWRRVDAPQAGTIASRFDLEIQRWETIGLELAAYVLASGSDVDRGPLAEWEMGTDLVKWINGRLFVDEVSAIGAAS